MKKMLFTGLMVLLTGHAGFLFAQNITVHSIAALGEEINKAKPGTTLVVADGVYTTKTPISIEIQGTADHPIVIRAANVGGVEIRGAGGFVIGHTSRYVRISGFKFTHEAGKTKIEAGAQFCRITRNIFECTGKGAYLTVSGNDNEIDHNTFQNKFTEGQMISVQGPGSSEMAQRTWIHHNYFSNFTPTSNNCSSIQVGLSWRSLSPSHTLVEYNLFSQTRGENENICNKSCDNIYRYNTFGDGVSELSLRHGNRCEVYGNYFIGSEGLRFYGHQHKIYSNYFEKCNPAINIGNGDGIVPKDKLTSHDRPDTVFIGFNTLYNNVKNVIMQGRKEGLGATCIVVANNIIQGGSVAAKIDGEIVHPTWEGNMIWKTDGIGSIPAGGYSKADPLLVPGAKETVHLQSKSPAIGASVGAYPFVNVDIDGQVRKSRLDIGADQSQKGKILNHVLTVEEVGPNAK
ncbi:MAG: polysaccharide lyase 6 family protein [Prolixibacteraceae bacterium]|nr:polysaccharide lyase 6 family protein [Prolixibacteraceae bacterium]